VSTGNIWPPGSNVRIGDADREAAEVLAETRRRLYGLLAEGEPE
jgi:hypothetical protein